MFTLYLGAVGSGKTSLMKDHVRRSTSPDVVSFFIIDHAGEWRDSGAPFPSARALRDAERIPRFCVFPATKQHEVAQLAIDVGSCVYVDDECDGAFDAKWKTNPIREILKRGRHLPNALGEIHEVGAMLATHRPANLPTDVTSLMRRVYIGRLQGFVDADRVWREGWIPEAQSVREVQRILGERGAGEFSMFDPKAAMQAVRRPDPMAKGPAR